MSSRPSPSKWTNHPSVSRNSAASPKAAAPLPLEANGKLLHVSSPQKMDRRVRRTRDALGDALIALMQEKPFDSITIQQVLDRAGIGRSTFYNHFRDKNDLFLSDVNDFFDFISTVLARRGDKSNRLAPVREFFAHVADAHRFMRAISDSQKLHDVLELAQGHFARGIAARLAAMPATKSMSPAGRAARAHALAGALVSMLTWWLTHQKTATPDQMDALFHQMAWSGLHPQPQHPSTPKNSYPFSQRRP